ncbi:MAG: helix-turn-helix transcriptional regulator [Rhizobiaceae bacterium]|nr:helix-turn-helix transcriptional regulator [Rhizobiaceae bacterium]
MAGAFAPSQILGMAKRVQPRFKNQPRRHFIRQWRLFRNLTQEQLAERVGVTIGTISQLETGRINYRQPLLEELAWALRCRPGDLLNVDPTTDGAFWSIWETLEPEQREQATRIIETFRKTGTEG